MNRQSGPITNDVNCHLKAVGRAQALIVDRPRAEIGNYGSESIRAGYLRQRRRPENHTVGVDGRAGGRHQELIGERVDGDVGVTRRIGHHHRPQIR